MEDAEKSGFPLSASHTKQLTLCSCWAPLVLSAPWPAVELEEVVEEDDDVTPPLLLEVLDVEVEVEKLLPKPCPRPDCGFSSKNSARILVISSSHAFLRCSMSALMSRNQSSSPW